MYQFSPDRGGGKQLRAALSDTLAMPRLKTRLAPLALPALFATCTPRVDLAAERGTPDAALATGASDPTAPSATVGVPELVDPSLNARLIPPNLARVVLRFLGPLRPPEAPAPLRLRGSDGSQVHMALGPTVACSGSGSCYAATPAAPLSPATSYTVEVIPEGLRMEAGKPVPAGDVGAFSTGDSLDEYAPLITGVAVSLSEGCVLARFITDEAAWPALVVSAGEQVVQLDLGPIASKFDVATRLYDLPPDIDATVSVRATDRAGNRADSVGLPVHLPPKLPRLVITEVLGNPAGSEGTQEFVELRNLEPEPVSLAGMTIEDKTGSDALPDVIVPAGGFALVLPEAYVLDDGKAPPPRENTVLARVSGKLGADGLANAGESARLVKGGYVVSQYGGWVNTNATAWNGRSLHRLSADSCDQPSAWTSTPQTPTPGW